MTQLALVIDLNVCVGCHACVTSCKQWNTSGWAGPLTDRNPYDADPTGTFFNRVQTFEVGVFPLTETVHFPKSCLHCEDPPCVPVCPTGASYKRPDNGVVLLANPLNFVRVVDALLSDLTSLLEVPTYERPLHPIVDAAHAFALFLRCLGLLARPLLAHLVAHATICVRLLHCGAIFE